MDERLIRACVEVERNVRGKNGRERVGAGGARGAGRMRADPLGGARVRSGARTHLKVSNFAREELAGRAGGDDALVALGSVDAGKEVSVDPSVYGVVRRAAPAEHGAEGEDDLILLGEVHLRGAELGEERRARSRRVVLLRRRVLATRQTARQHRPDVARGVRE